MTNPILDQLHKTRQELLANAGGTLDGLVAALQQRQQQSGRRILKAERLDSHAKAAKPAVEFPTSPTVGR